MQQQVIDHNLPNHTEDDDDERIVLNVGGQTFEVRRSTLIRYPKTRLGSLFLSEKNNRDVKPDKRGHYFFDRNPKIFDIILDFYRTGKLSTTSDVPLDKLQEEIRYWKVDIDATPVEFVDKNARDIENETNEEEDVLNQPAEEVFEKAYGLIRGTKLQIRQGVSWLEGLLEKEETRLLDLSMQQKSTESLSSTPSTPQPNSIPQETNEGLTIASVALLGQELQFVKQLYYFLALGYHRLGDSSRAHEFVHHFLELEPNSKLAQSLDTLVKDKQDLNARVGFLALFAAATITIMYYWRK